MPGSRVASEGRLAVGPTASGSVSWVPPVPRGFELVYQEVLVDTVDRASYTFNAAFGAPDRDRRILVTTGHRGTGGEVAGVTIAGVQASRQERVQSTDTWSEAALWSAPVPNGERGDIVVTLNPNTRGMGIGVWALYAAGAQNFTTIFFRGNPVDWFFDVPADGVVLGYSNTLGTGTTGGAWSGLDERFAGPPIENVLQTGADATPPNWPGGQLQIGLNWNGTPGNTLTILATVGPPQPLQP